MASGYFPLHRNDDEGHKLVEAMRLLREVASDIGAASSTNCVPEDAVRDGEYIANLNKAVSLIAPCLEGHVTHRGCCIKAQRVLTRYLQPDSGLSAQDAISEVLAILDGPDWRAAEGGAS